MASSKQLLKSVARSPKATSIRKSAPHPSVADSPKPTAGSTDQRSGRATPKNLSKKEIVLGMLRRPKGSTIAAIVKATDWQQHSVRGFLAGVVKRKLKFALVSDNSNGERTYRILRSGPAS
jgi:hypothetical protein